jgi:hypothetical protein
LVRWRRSANPSCHRRRGWPAPCPWAARTARRNAFDPALGQMNAIALVDRSRHRRRLPRTWRPATLRVAEQRLESVRPRPCWSNSRWNDDDLMRAVRTPQTANPPEGFAKRRRHRTSSAHPPRLQTWVLSELGHSLKELRTVTCVKDLDGWNPKPPSPHSPPSKPRSRGFCFLDKRRGKLGQSHFFSPSAVGGGGSFITRLSRFRAVSNVSGGTNAYMIGLGA